MAEEENFKNNDINNKLDKLFDYLKETNKTNNIQIENINKRLDKIKLKIFKEKIMIMFYFLIKRNLMYLLLIIVHP